MNEKYINLSSEERVSLCLNKINQVLSDFGCTVVAQVIDSAPQSASVGNNNKDMDETNTVEPESN